jgi:hypothetical protein
MDGNPGANWTIVAIGDFDGNGDWDILWKDTSGNVAIWQMSGLHGRPTGCGRAVRSFSFTTSHCDPHPVAKSLSAAVSPH